LEKKKKKKTKEWRIYHTCNWGIVTPGNDSIISHSSSTDNLQIQAIRYTESMDSEEITAGQLRLTFSEDSDNIPLSQLPQLEQLRQTRKLM
jgi:hypothetical protein